MTQETLQADLILNTEKLVSLMDRFLKQIFVERFKNFGTTEIARNRGCLKMEATQGFSPKIFRYTYWTYWDQSLQIVDSNVFLLPSATNVFCCSSAVTVFVLLDKDCKHHNKPFIGLYCVPMNCGHCVEWGIKVESCKDDVVIVEDHVGTCIEMSFPCVHVFANR